eukprot:gene53624-33151_t
MSAAGPRDDGASVAAAAAGIAPSRAPATHSTEQWAHPLNGTPAAAKD